MLLGIWFLKDMGVLTLYFVKTLCVAGPLAGGKEYYAPLWFGGLGKQISLPDHRLCGRAGVTLACILSKDIKDIICQHLSRSSLL